MRRTLRSLNLKSTSSNLEKLGFKDGVLLSKINEQFSLRFELVGEEIIVRAIDNDFGDEYAPFNVENNHGDTTLFLREKAEEILQFFKDKIGSNSLDRETLFKHISETYLVEPTHPFQDPAEAIVFRNEFGKWFVLYMVVNAKHFYKDREDEVEVINIKLPPEKVKETIKQGIAHTCYHMNKKYWVSIILDEVTLDEISPLILLSYIESGAKGYN
ncbi:MAG: MmcQ/YjbR family DNA-binding protein [Bacilli bacterium]|nr:MmcQ/YjbR family DNA-binding protein [Bacilli bacterium]